MAARALAQNPSGVAVYVLLSVGVSALQNVFNMVVAGEILFSPGGGGLRVYRFGMDLFLAAGSSAAAVAGFSRLGRAIDRPVWKVAGDREAFARFFVWWFIVSLSFVTLFSLLGLVSDAAPGSSGRLLLKLAFFLMFLFAVPVGACVMFSGRLVWRDLAQDLAPLVHQWPRTAAVLFVNYLMFAAYLAVAALLVERPELRTRQWGTLLLEVPFAAGDCFVFAATWLICMTHRREVEERNRELGF